MACLVNNWAFQQGACTVARTRAGDGAVIGHNKSGQCRFRGSREICAISSLELRALVRAPLHASMHAPLTTDGLDRRK